jgi:hypothetical protein
MSTVHYFPDKLNVTKHTTVGGSAFFGLGERGLLGQMIDLTRTEALALSDTTVGTLLEGTYQYVQIDSTAPDTGNELLDRGHAVYWVDRAAFTVTTDATAVTLGNFAGVIINPSSGANALAPGNYCWIQVDGEATVETAAAGAAVTGLVCTLGAATSNFFLSAADAGADATSGSDKINVGTFSSATTGAGPATGTVQMKNVFRNYCR